MNRTVDRFFRIAVSTVLLATCLVSCKTADVELGMQMDQQKVQLESLQNQMAEMQDQIAQLQNQMDNITTSEVPQAEPTVIEEEIAAEPETVTLGEEPLEENSEEPVNEIVELPFWEIGQIGPFGGLVFQMDGKCYEMAGPLYEAGSYEDAVAYCESLTSEMTFANPYRLPSVDELLAIYDQLVMTELSEIDWTYYWSCEEVDETSAKVVNFDTGFDGKFYKSMDFVSALPICEL